MKILAIDTSSKNASVAILENTNTLIELNNNDEKTHSQKLMPMIDEAFQKLSISLDNIDLISCSLGPGSFTGVRIGIATAKAFSDSREIPTVGISSLESLAHNLMQEGVICCLINANNGNVYAGIFEIVKDKEFDCFKTIKSSLTFLSFKNEDGIIASKPIIDFLEKNNNIVSSSSKIYFVGDAAVLYKDLLNDLPFNIHLCDEKYGIASGISIGKVGYIKYKNDEYGNSSFLSPIYLRKSQAEIAMEEKLGLK